LVKRKMPDDPIKIFGVILVSFIGIILFLSLIPLINDAFSPKECPACDCSSYSNNLTTCLQNLSNLTKDLEERPVEYIQNVTYVDVPIDKPIYKDNPISITIISFTFILSIFLTIKLFKIEIRLSKKLEEKLERIDKWIVRLKWISLVVTILILIKLIFILFSLF